MLSIQGLVKRIPSGRVLFADLALQLNSGEFVAVMGESGVGKSSLLNLIAGLERADAGVILLEGINLAALSDDALTILRRDRMGFVFQAFHILPHLSLAQNVALPLLLQHRPAKEALARAHAMLEALGLAARGDDFPRQLSGGELQRVAIARALIHHPALILADEPTGNLDPRSAALVLALFAAQVREHGAAVILVTHSETAARHADRVLQLGETGLHAADSTALG